MTAYIAETYLIVYLIQVNYTTKKLFLKRHIHLFLPQDGMILITTVLFKFLLAGIKCLKSRNKNPQ